MEGKKLRKENLNQQITIFYVTYYFSGFVIKKESTRLMSTKTSASGQSQMLKKAPKEGIAKSAASKKEIRQQHQVWKA